MEPRIRVSALLRWQDWDPPVPPREAGRGEYGCCRRRRQFGGRASSTRCTASSREEVGIEDEIPVEGPVALVDSISPVRAFAAKHVVHIIFAGDLSGRSLEAVTSSDAAVRGHRLFDPADLEGVVLHPPIERLPPALGAGGSRRVLGLLWAP